jgi:hypothetical protein
MLINETQTIYVSNITKIKANLISDPSDKQNMTLMNVPTNIYF